jgi:hypothetical protein
MLLLKWARSRIICVTFWGAGMLPIWASLGSIVVFMSRIQLSCPKTQTDGVRRHGLRIRRRSMDAAESSVVHEPISGLSPREFLEEVELCEDPLGNLALIICLYFDSAYWLLCDVCALRPLLRTLPQIVPAKKPLHHTIWCKVNLCGLRTTKIHARHNPACTCEPKMSEGPILPSRVRSLPPLSEKFPAPPTRPRLARIHKLESAQGPAPIKRKTSAQRAHDKQCALDSKLSENPMA